MYGWPMPTSMEPMMSQVDSTSIRSLMGEAATPKVAAVTRAEESASPARYRSAG
jgi:hypothetical protein